MPTVGCVFGWCVLENVGASRRNYLAFSTDGFLRRLPTKVDFSRRVCVLTSDCIHDHAIYA